MHFGTHWGREYSKEDGDGQKKKNRGPQAKSNQPPAFVDKTLLEHSQPHTLIYRLLVFCP